MIILLSILPTPRKYSISTLSLILEGGSIEVSGNLANALHKWMPFTYTVDAFRSAISGGGSIATEMIVLCSIIVVFSGLTIIVFNIRGLKVKNNKKLIYEWIEEKGLA